MLINKETHKFNSFWYSISRVKRLPGKGNKGFIGKNPFVGVSFLFFVKVVKSTSFPPLVTPCHFKLIFQFIMSSCNKLLRNAMSKFTFVNHYRVRHKFCIILQEKYQQFTLGCQFFLPKKKAIRDNVFPKSDSFEIDKNNQVHHSLI